MSERTSKCTKCLAPVATATYLELDLLCRRCFKEKWPRKVATVEPRMRIRKRSA